METEFDDIHDADARAAALTEWRLHRSLFTARMDQSAAFNRDHVAGLVALQRRLTAAIEAGRLVATVQTLSAAEMHLLAFCLTDVIDTALVAGLDLVIDELTDPADGDEEPSPVF
jgi:hypothetical protein